jgi:hypothetical protein
MKKWIYLIVLFFIPFCVKSQQVALTHSNTQYDAFENPVQTGFVKEQSRKYAITLFPSLDGFIYFNGASETALKKLLFTRIIPAAGYGDIGLGKTNQININGNVYLFNYRIYKTVNYSRELGFSLQFRNDGQAFVTNETLSVLNSINQFNKTSYVDIFNTKAYNQAYYQLSATYRENYNDMWGFGAKVSLLNGATYTKININSSNLQINIDNSLDANFVGNYTSSFGIDSFTYKKLLPNLKNMGVAISGGVSYTHPKGLYVTFNIRDLGFIRWNKNTPVYNFNGNARVNNVNSSNANNQFSAQVGDVLTNSKTTKRFITTVDTKVILAASKNFGFYTPVFVFSKSTFRKDGQIGLLNNFRKNAFNLGLNPIYDFQTKLNLGTQLLIKSPNAEFFVGSEQLFPTYYLAKGYIKNDENLGRAQPRANIYLGLTMKFGGKMQNIGNADEIPGLNDKETGYVVRLSNKERKALQKKNKGINKKRNKNNKRNGF